MKIHAPAAVRGFTLIELMVTVAIIGILSAIALPAYTDYVIRGRIPEAISGLDSRRASILTHYDNTSPPTYAGALSCTPDATGKYFDFDCPVATAITYTIRARGKGAMAGFVYTLRVGDARATTGVPSGWVPSTTCWVTQKGGAC